MWRKLLRAARAVVYLMLLGVLFTLAAYVSFSQFIRRGVTPAPELFGLAEEEARALAADQGLRISWSEEERFDDRVPPGHVVGQRPRPGTLVKRGSTVTVWVSRGPRQVEVPPVIGEALQAAQVTLAAAGLTVGHTVSIYSDDGRDGIVVGQQPGPGSLVEPGAPIALFLSLKSTGRTYLMPDLVKRDYEAVRRFFERRGFRIGRIGYVTYDGVAPGTVLRQFPVAGHPLRPGDVISLGVVAPEVAPPQVAPAAGGAGNEGAPSS